MLKIPFFLYMCAMTFVPATGQDTLSLPMCLHNAERIYPSASDPEIYKSISDYRMANIRSAWYPSLDLNGQASWQSDVVTIDVEFPTPGITFPVSPKDQYRVSLDIRQALYDGGISKKLQQVERIQALIDREEFNMGLNTLKETVCDLYFSILMLEGSEKVLATHLNKLGKNHDIAIASFKNGVLLESDVLLLEAELIKIRQEYTEISGLKQMAMKSLSLLTGLNIEKSTLLSRPELAFDPYTGTNRYENRVFDLKRQQFKENIKLVNSKQLPYAFTFTQLGYGRPGLNILNDGFDTYAVVGVGLKWNIWDWDQTKRERKIFGLQADLIENRKESFNQLLETALLNKLTLIEQHKAKIQNARALHELRSRISAGFSVQLEKGVIRTIDYLTVFNEELIAEIQYETEKVLLQKAISEYLLLKGDL